MANETGLEVAEHVAQIAAAAPSLTPLPTQVSADACGATEGSQGTLHAKAPTQSPRCPKCKKGTSLVLRDYDDGWRLVCGANCGLIVDVNAATGLEFDLASFAQFFSTQEAARCCPKCGSKVCAPYKSTETGLWTQRCDKCEWFDSWAGAQEGQ